VGSSGPQTPNATPTYTTWLVYLGAGLVGHLAKQVTNIAAK